MPGQLAVLYAYFERLRRGEKSQAEKSERQKSSGKRNVKNKKKQQQKKVGKKRNHANKHTDLAYTHANLVAVTSPSHRGNTHSHTHVYAHAKQPAAVYTRAYPSTRTPPPYTDRVGAADTAGLTGRGEPNLK